MTAPAHPAPWREVCNDFGSEHRVIDANGDQVIGPDNMSGVCFASPAARELVLAAPELEAIMREIEFAGGEDGTECPVCHGVTEYREQDGKHAPGCKLGDLIARLNEARRG